MAIVNCIQLHGGITSVSIVTKGEEKGRVLAYVGADSGNIYQVFVNLQNGEFMQQLVQSAHNSAVTAVGFAELYGEVCSYFPAFTILWESLTWKPLWCMLHIQICGADHIGVLAWLASHQHKQQQGRALMTALSLSVMP
jgi:hypothetical protein